VDTLGEKWRSGFHHFPIVSFLSLIYKMEWLTPKLSRAQYRDAYLATLQRQITINDANYTANQAFAEDGTAAELDTTGMSRRAIINALSLKFVKFTRNPSASLTMLSDTQLNTLAQISDAVVNEFNAKGPNTNYRGDPIDSQLFLKDLMEMMGANNLGNMAMKQKETMLRTHLITPSAPNGDNIDGKVDVNNFVPAENEDKIGTNMGKDSNHSDDKKGKIELDQNNIVVDSQKSTPAKDRTWSEFISGKPANSPADKEGVQEVPAKNTEVQKLPAKEKVKIESDKNTDKKDKIKKAFDSLIKVYKEGSNYVTGEHKISDNKVKFQGDFKAALHDSGVTLEGTPLQHINKYNTDSIRQFSHVNTSHLEAVRDHHINEVSGFGLRRKLEKKEKRGRVMYGTGLRSFGHYNLDMHELDKNNRVTLRYKNNRKVHTIPSNLVGGNLISCLKSVVEGKNPSYKDVSSLTDAEKDYLNEIGNKAEIEELSQIKSGTKDEEDRDFHQFQILTGEISAGNDSKQLVSDYKKLMLKLMSKGRIDRNSGKSILMDLAVIGY